MTERDSTIELSREELIERLQRECMRRRGISVHQLLQDYRSGRLEDPGDVADLLALAGLLPEDDPVYARP